MQPPRAMENTFFIKRERQVFPKAGKRALVFVPRNRLAG